MKEIPKGIDPEIGLRVWEQMNSRHIAPEIQKRREYGDIEDPFKLVAAQVIFNRDGLVAVKPCGW